VVGVDLHDAEIEADLATADGRAAMVDGVRSAAGSRVDAVIACAGIAADVPLTVQVNFFGAIATLEGLRPLLTAGIDPRAVAIASIASIHPVDDDTVDACLAGDEPRAVAAAEGKGYLIYASSKQAVARWVRRTAPSNAWAGAGIALNAVAPGVVITPMTSAMLDDPEMRPLMDTGVPMPFRGHATADDVAHVLAWLASPQNARVTGQVVFVDGGADAVLRGDTTW
jgi:NAD(P)-dependent dehydrogenase (short-subunit alcohol dehydrogenase family)